MDRAKKLFALASLEELREPGRLLRSAFATRVHPRRVERVLYLDTFDRRLADAGGELEAVEAPDGHELSWRREEAPTMVARARVLPAFRDDLPPGALRRELETRIERRRLMEIARVERATEALDVLDDAEKTVVRVELVERRAREPGAPAEDGWRSLPPVVALRPVRGYDEWRERVERFLRAELGLVPHERGELADALAALGHAASADERAPLAPTTSALDALRAVLRQRLGSLRENEEGVVQDLDPEFLHDLRIAIRWTRVLLRRFRRVLPEPFAEHFAGEFRWLGRACGPTRDLDVLLERLDEHERSRDDAYPPPLAPLREFLVRERAREFAELVLALRSERYRTLVASWAELLERDPGALDPDSPAARPILEVASRCAWRSYKRLLRRGERLGPGSSAERFHALRIRGKTLRYVVESFRELYPPDEIERALRDLRRLQTALGALNDCEGQIALLENAANALSAEGRAAAETLIAIGRLAGRLEERRASQRERSIRRLRRLARRAGRERFRALFRDPGKPP